MSDSSMPAGAPATAVADAPGDVHADAPQPAPAGLPSGPVDRSLVMVAGSGRSGTSLFAGTLQRLGFRVPQPEVPPDESNPRGFAESQWVVDFHTRLLQAVRVQTADARPTAWTATASISNKPAEVEALRAFLKDQYGHGDHLVIKDPRLSWFLPLWRRCADEYGAQTKFVTMLRHPAAVVDSKARYYGNWQGDVGRAAGWINGMLFTERATRESTRVFVRYDDLLEDWTKVIARVGEVCGLSVIRNAQPPAIRKVHQFIDPSLSRSSSSWDDIRMPTELRDLCEHVWQLLNALAADDADEAKIGRGLDEARSAYLELYQSAEAIAQSSIAAARPAPGTVIRKAAGSGTPVISWVPRDLRHKVPVRYRRKVLYAVNRLRGRALAPAKRTVPGTK